MAHERLFDYPFDFQEYIAKRLREINDVEERRFTKAILQDGLLTIINETEKKYAHLEKRVFEEVENKISKYEIRMTIIRREEYDPVNHTWTPVLAEDMRKYQITDEDLKAAAEEKKPCIEEDLPEAARFSQAEVEYGSYADFILDDIITLWNLEKIQYNSSQFHVPCIDCVNYEHDFPLKDFGVEHGYLFGNNESITGVRFQSEKSRSYRLKRYSRNGKRIKLLPTNPYSRWATPIAC